MGGVAAEVCRSALLEIGRPDLANTIGTNKVGDPMRRPSAYYGIDAELVARALILSNNKIDLPLTVVASMLRTERTHLQQTKHWSPRLKQWCDRFEPKDWEAV